MAARHVLENLTVDWQTLCGPFRGPDRFPATGGGRPPPTLDTFRAEDLRSVPALLALYRDAVSRGLVTRSKDALVAFLSTAAYALRVGDSPPGLFLHLIRSGRFPASHEDEDRALTAFKRHRAPADPARHWLRITPDGDRHTVPAPPRPPGPSRDALLLDAVRAELERRGLSGRPFAALRACGGWDRARHGADLAPLEDDHPATGAGVEPANEGPDPRPENGAGNPGENP